MEVALRREKFMSRFCIVHTLNNVHAERGALLTWNTLRMSGSACCSQASQAWSMAVSVGWTMTWVTPLGSACRKDRTLTPWRHAKTTASVSR